MGKKRNRYPKQNKREQRVNLAKKSPSEATAASSESRGDTLAPAQRSINERRSKPKSTVPTEKTITDQIKAFLSEYFNLISILILIAGAISSFNIFRSDIEEVKKDSHENKLEINGIQNKVNELRTDQALVAKDITYIKEDIKSVNLDTDDIKKQFREIEKDLITQKANGNSKTEYHPNKVTHK